MSEAVSRPLDVTSEVRIRKELVERAAEDRVQGDGCATTDCTLEAVCEAKGYTRRAELGLRLTAARRKLRSQLNQGDAARGKLRVQRRSARENIRWRWQSALKGVRVQHK